MIFSDCIKNISTTIELKRIASAYVIDSKNLNKEELESALLKTAQQYFNFDNVKKAYYDLFLSEKRNERLLSEIILNEILLNKYDYQKEQKFVNEEVIAYEQSIINISNEIEDKFFDEKTNLLKFVLKVAWDNNNNISTDENNLIEKLRNELNITNKDYRIIEACLGKFPKNNNEVHLISEIDEVRKSLQQKGLLFSIRTDSGIDYDIIPEEIAKPLKILFKKEMRSYGYKQLISSKYVRNKDYLFYILKKANIEISDYAKLPELQAAIMEKIKPSNLLGGFSPKDGLDKEVLWQWCNDLKINTSGSKNELIERIIEYYDELKKVPTNTNDTREIYFNYFAELASRETKTLRQQGILQKDIECERKFEEATNYIFEKILRQKPLIMKGTNHPDGMLSYQNKLIMWDNKSKESPVKLKEHIAQFDSYIRNSDKPVSVFIVIGPDFTDDSNSECIKYSLNSDTLILLLKASDLKEVALKWNSIHKNDEAVFNLGYFKQSGAFNKNLIVF